MSFDSSARGACSGSFWVLACFRSFRGGLPVHCGPSGIPLSICGLLLGIVGRCGLSLGVLWFLFSVPLASPPVPGSVPGSVPIHPTFSYPASGPRARNRLRGYLDFDG